MYEYTTRFTKRSIRPRQLLQAGCHQTPHRGNPICKIIYSRMEALYLVLHDAAVNVNKYRPPRDTPSIRRGGGVYVDRCMTGT
jgi:hypothetical protein